LLKAGTTYHTAVFKPQITFRLPSNGWQNIADEGGIFELLYIGSPGDGIFFFRNPTATTPDGKVVAGVGDSVAELASWLAKNDQLEVSAAKQVTVGGLKGLVMDVRIAADATSAGPRDCPTRVCVAFFTATDPSPRPVWQWDWGLAGPETNRLYLLTTSDGVVAIVVESADGTTFDPMTKAADEVLPTVKFG
jgi:hypothetical protein